MFQTGLRIGEVCAVRFGDIEGDELHFQRTVERDTKNIKDGLKGDNIERWVMLSSEAGHIINEAKARQIAAGVYQWTVTAFLTDWFRSPSGNTASLQVSLTGVRLRHLSHLQYAPLIVFHIRRSVCLIE